MFAPTPAGFQPLLHELSTCLSAPTVALSAGDGQIRPDGAQGLFSADIRLLSRAEVEVPGTELEPISGALHGADRAEFVAVLRGLGDPGPDPTVWLRRRRTVRPDGMDESFSIENASGSGFALTLTLRWAADLADIEVVKAGAAPTELVAGELTPAGLEFATAEVRAIAQAPGAELALECGQAHARWQLRVPARGTVTVNATITVADAGAAVIAAPVGVWSADHLEPDRPPAHLEPDRPPANLEPDRPPARPNPARAGGAAGRAAGDRSDSVDPAGLTVVADDRRLGRLVSRSLADLAALRMATPGQPADVFYAAGSPWYLTLFGRDSLWAARLGLPLGTSVAAGTLRTLAARQASTTDIATAAEPGKILHELRRPRRSLADPMLPPVYYGTVDATLLWVILLEQAWRWGMSEEAAAGLLPAAERALDWMAESGDSDGDGFLEYADASGRGLTNQGWKDSGDAVRFADGRIADGPVALAEVQGYAYQAALAGASLLDGLGRPGAARWRDYATGLAAKFRQKFWCTDNLGPYPAMALDGAKNRVDAPASNMGHLLGTGILSAGESAAVANRLIAPGLSSGFGLRTMSATAGGYSPLSYHCGSVWPHDTAIAVAGLSAAGFPAQAGVLTAGLLAAADAFDGRFPELYSGWSAEETEIPVPYPAACRPQAWSAAAAVVLVQSLLGLRVDVPAGTLTLAPVSTAGALAVAGLQVAGDRLNVRVDSSGRVLEVDYAGPLRVRVGQHVAPTPAPPGAPAGTADPARW